MHGARWVLELVGGMLCNVYDCLTTMLSYTLYTGLHIVMFVGHLGAWGPKETSWSSLIADNVQLSSLQR